eukprot:12395-Heterococcus_DN1.PRE.3
MNYCTGLRNLASPDQDKVDAYSGFHNGRSTPVSNTKSTLTISTVGLLLLQLLLLALPLLSPVFAAASFNPDGIDSDVSYG